MWPTRVRPESWLGCLSKESKQSKAHHPLNNCLRGFRYNKQTNNNSGTAPRSRVRERVLPENLLEAGRLVFSSKILPSPLPPPPPLTTPFNFAYALLLSNGSSLDHHHPPALQQNFLQKCVVTSINPSVQHFSSFRH